MRAKIIVNVAVDTIAALSTRTLKDHVYLMDDNLLDLSVGQGTDHLCTTCRPGQLIKWKATPIDLQTPASIRNISFLGAGIKPGSDTVIPDDGIGPWYSNPDLNEWSGIVPHHLVPGLAYQYRITIQMGEGDLNLLDIDSPSIRTI